MAPSTPKATIRDAPLLQPSVEDSRETIDMEHEGDSNDVEMNFVGCVAASQGIGSLEPSVDDQVSQLLFAEMGSSGRIRRRDGRKAFRKLVSEIYSPPRVTDLLSKMRSRHIMAGFRSRSHGAR